MRFMKANHLRVTTLALSFMLVSVHPTHAVLLAPGGSVPLSGTTSAARPELAGVVLADVIRPFSVNLFAGGIISGTIQDRVVREDVSGTLDFYYRIFNDANSPGIVISASRSNFSGFSVDVDFRIDGLGTVPPSPAIRTLSGEQVQFNFSQTPSTAGSLDAGEESRFFFVRTNATSFDEGGTLRIDAANPIAVIGGSTFLTTFQPTAVPEPASLLLLGSGVAGLAAWRWRNSMQA